MHKIILVAIILLTAACNQSEKSSTFSSNPTALDCTAVEGVKILSQSINHVPISEGGLPNPEVGSPLAPFSPKVHVARYNYFLEMAKSEGLVKVHNCGACGYIFPYQEVIDKMAAYREELASANINEWFPRVYNNCSSIIDRSLRSHLAPDD